MIGTYAHNLYYINRKCGNGMRSEGVVSRHYWWYMRFSRFWKWKVYKDFYVLYEKE